LFARIVAALFALTKSSAYNASSIVIKFYYFKLILVPKIYASSFLQIKSILSMLK